MIYPDPIWHDEPYDNAGHEEATLKDPAIDLFNMHRKFDFHGVPLDKQQLKGRLDFLQEELDEAYKALEENNAPDFVDAHIDLVVVAIGTMDLSRVNFWKAWNRVHLANMSKERGKNTKRPNMGGFDLTKPEGWRPPDHEDNTGILTSIMLNDEGYKRASSLDAVAKQRRYALEFLEKCKQIMLEKADDYNYPDSPVRTIDYYPRGAWDLFHMIHIKYTRIKSLLHKLEKGGEIKNEDIPETLRDNIIFSAMFAEFLAKEMDGQNPKDSIFGEY
jgi:hypothetical protein